MAEVQHSTRTVTRTVEVEEPVVELTLTEEEAQVMADTMAAVGGCPRSSYRKHTQALVDALRDAGIRWRSPSLIGQRGNIYYQPQEDT